MSKKPNPFEGALVTGEQVRVIETGEEGTLLSVARGWHEVEFEDGATKKFRADKLEPVKDEEPEEQEPEEQEPEDHGNWRGDRLKANRKQYVDGKHCGDAVAVALNGAQLGPLLELCERWGLNPSKWDELNPGQQRMNAGNRIRARMKKLGEDEWKAAHAELVALPARIDVKWYVLRNGKIAKRSGSEALAKAWMEEARAKAKGDFTWEVKKAA